MPLLGLLTNVLYCGEVRHKGKVYAGERDPGVPLMEPGKGRCLRAFRPVLPPRPYQWLHRPVL